jgi:AAA15 family ATPase/GTPase
MLVNFSVTNFRSINEKQTIDMEVATKYHKKITKPGETESFENNFFKTGQESSEELLKSAAIYGANASGKSNLVKAIFAFNHVVMRFEAGGKDGKRSRGDSIVPYDPFLLDEQSCERPTEFEIDFITEGRRYVYSFGYDKKRIHHERLECYYEKKKLIYELVLDEKNQLKPNFTELFHGKKERALDIIKNTENNLFLPLNINEDGNDFLNPIYDWIAEKLLIKGSHDSFDQTLRWIQSDVSKKNKKNTLKLLKRIDVGITDFEIEEIERNLPKTISEDETIPVVRFKTSNGCSFKESQISLGTAAVFGLCSVIFPILENGGVLFFDELDRSLHPDILIEIVKMFHDKKANKGNGQIVFTAHNDILLEKEYSLLRRDQIWFVGKVKKTHATELYSLSEFPAETKKRDNIAELYRNHVYGARPILKSEN